MRLSVAGNYGVRMGMTSEHLQTIKTKNPFRPWSDIARELGVSRQMVHALLSGKKKPGKDLADKIEKMASACD